MDAYFSQWYLCESECNSHTNPTFYANSGYATHTSLGKNAEEYIGLNR